MIRGVSVQLKVKTQTGVDAINNPVYKETTETVDNVLVGEPTTDDINNSLNLYGKKVHCVLAIPKGDTHDWTDTKVILPEESGNPGVFKTIGYPVGGIETMIPLSWNKKVMVERYAEGGV